MPLTAAEIKLHPEYPHVHWEHAARQKGTVDVARGRGGPFKIAYELHGNGPRKLVFITGLGGFMRTWQRQVKDFGHTEADKYSVLVFDNRGMGDSDKPLLRYTTSEMAKDVIELLDHIGWTQERSVHLIGISMGGMISQELGLLIPTRFCSVSLISTAPRIVRTKPFFENLRNRINLMVPKPIDAQIAKVKADCYNPEWLIKPDETESVVQPFPTNGDRFAAQELSKRLSVGKFTRKGFLAQLYAAGFHHKSAEQLKKLGDEVERRRIMLFHGTGDHMVTFTPHAELLVTELGGRDSGLTVHHVPGIGHVSPYEWRWDFNKIVAEHVERTEKL